MPDNNQQATFVANDSWTKKLVAGGLSNLVKNNYTAGRHDLAVLLGPSGKCVRNRGARRGGLKKVKIRKKQTN